MASTTGWATLEMEVTTPLFNGGAAAVGKDGKPEPDLTGIRAPSLRGAMRFWFRALAAIITGADTALLAKLEHDVFGHTDHASPVRLRIPSQPPLTPADGKHSFLPARNAPPRERQQHPGHWIVYLLGQGLGDLRATTVTRPYVAPGESFELKVSFRRDIEHAEGAAALAIASLWLACAYGGIGGRSRRGFGGVRITGTSGHLPSPWDAATVTSPGLAHYEQLSQLWPSGPVGQCVPFLKPLVQRHGGRFGFAQWDAPPPFPVLSKEHTIAGVSGGEAFSDWAGVLAYAGEQLRRFRASKNYPAAPYHPQIKTPEWDEVVWGNGEHFGLGALGLPVVYKGGSQVDVISGRDTLRRASPLWLRPVGAGDDWRLLSFAFCGQFLPGPDRAAVYLRQEGRQPRKLTVTDDDTAELASAWINKLAADEWFKPGDRPFTKSN
jgi:CRISPR-associated protein Cmr1